METGEAVTIPPSCPGQFPFAPPPVLEFLPASSHNPTVLPWSIPTYFRDVTSAETLRKSHNPTVLPWSIPTFAWRINTPSAC